MSLSHRAVRISDLRSLPCRPSPLRCVSFKNGPSFGCRKRSYRAFCGKSVHTSDASPTTAPKFSYWKEFKSLMTASSPAFAYISLLFCTSTMNMIFIGKLGAVQLSVASLATAFYYLIGSTILYGMTLGIETIGGQAHGAQNVSLSAAAYYLGLCLSVTGAIFISLIWTQSEWIFIKLGQNAEIAKKAALYLQLLSPNLCLEAIFSSKARSLTSRGIVRPTTVACTLAIASSPFLSWFFILKTPLGLYGAPIAQTLTSLASVAILFHLTRSYRFPIPFSPHIFFKDRWKMLKKYMALSLPIMATACCDWWTFEIFVFLAGLVAHPEINLAVMGAANSIINILFVSSYALAGGTIARVSNYLGAGDKHSALSSIRTCVSTAFMFETFVLVSVFLCSKQISRLWFSERHGIQLLTMIIPFTAITEWGSGIAYVMGSILRACNRAKYDLVANFLSFWSIGIPLGLILGLRLGMGIRGFWIALVVASQLQLWSVSAILSSLDFDLEIRRARELTITKH